MKPISLLVAVAVSAALAAQAPVTAEGKLKTVDPKNGRERPPVQLPQDPMTLSQKTPAGVVAPANLTDVWYGQRKIGGKDRTIAIGKGKADAERADTLIADLNGDGKLLADEAVALEEMPGRNTPKPLAANATFENAGAKMPAMMVFVKPPEGDPTLYLQFLNYLEATVKVGSGDKLVAVVDKNLDGKFDSAEDEWGIKDAAGKQAISAFALNAHGERAFLDGNLIGLKVGTNNMLSLTATPATGPDPKEAAEHRARVEKIWTERFDKEREQFVTQRKLDTSRPKAKEEIHWNYVSFDDAIALGKKANKPVFIDVMAFWCVWCYRMDYYTYPDQEVAELLNSKFVPCKIIQEQAKDGDYDMMMKKLEARGIPAMGIFDGEGNKVHMIGGWNPPDKFVEELQKGLSGK
ncbi:MAG: DUF255 domain-containing protein [Planctomycetota bacterium]